jgi:hypothetical protein
VVVFPAPLGPMSAVMPSAASKSTPCKTSMPSYEPRSDLTLRIPRGPPPRRARGASRDMPQ